jgi:hypothetical protein
MSYIKPQDYSKQIANLLSEGLDNVTGMVTEPTIVTVKEAIKNLTTEEREQLQQYAASLKEIKTEMNKIIAKGKKGKTVDETGGNMMNLTMPTEE